MPLVSRETRETFGEYNARKRLLHYENMGHMTIGVSILGLRIVVSHRRGGGSHLMSYPIYFHPKCIASFDLQAPLIGQKAYLARKKNLKSRAMWGTELAT